MNSDLNFDIQIKTIIKHTYYHLKNISRIEGISLQQGLEKLDHGLIFRLEYSKAVSTGLSKNSIQISFIPKPQYHKSQFESESFTAYNIALSLDPHKPEGKTPPKKPLTRKKKLAESSGRATKKSSLRPGEWKVSCYLCGLPVCQRIYFIILL